MLEIPPSTLRRYVKEYADHLTDLATKKRGRRFTELDIATLARVRTLLQQGRNPEEVNELMGVVGIEEGDASADSALALVPTISHALSELEDAAQGIRLDLEDLSNNQTESERRLAEIETWMSRPWYKRLFASRLPKTKKPPG
jgi:DNA-binding transcriptional MerR regulator